MPSKPVRKSTAKSKRARCPRPARISKAKKHPWRICPEGEHWVRTHDRQVKVSKKNPDGTTSVEGHCRKNRSSKDEIYPPEIHKIAEQNFSSLTGPPKADSLGFANGNKYDTLIRGWTKYWNEVFKPKEPLDPDLVKALIATESSFKPDAKTGKKDVARGLMQVRDSTIKIMSDECGELRDHLLNMDQKEAYDPNVNIAAGIRWLFRKKETVTARLKREASWDEAVEEYKGLLKSRLAGKSDKKGLMEKVRKYYKRLKS